MRALEDVRSMVRSTKSRKYIDEAIDAYGAGAYRAAILALWIAVVSDLIDKISILAEAGEPGALILRTSLRKAIDNNDRVALQKFESKLLEDARDSLHIIGESEYRDLKRLLEDRHLCAHPAHVTDDELFDPGPERVRAHLACAVDHLLMHGPTVGKKAIERFKREVQGTSFPSEDSKLAAYLDASYIERGTPALRVNLCKVACKATLDPALGPETRWRYTRVTHQLYRIAPTEFEQSLKDVLEGRQDSLNDDGLLLLIGGLCSLDCTWRHLHEGVRNRSLQLLKDVPLKIIVADYELFRAIPAAPLDLLLLDRLGQAATSKELSGHLNDQLWQNPDERIIPCVIELITEVGNYYDAEGAVRTLVALSAKLSPADLKAALDAAGGNDQVCGSGLANRELKQLRRSTESRSPEMQELWEAYANRHGSKE